MTAADIAVTQLFALGTTLIDAGRPRAAALALQAAAEVPGARSSPSQQVSLLLLAAKPPLPAAHAAELLVSAARILSGLPSTSTDSLVTRLRAARAGLAELHGLAASTPGQGTEGQLWHSMAVAARVARLRRNKESLAAVREAKKAASMSSQDGHVIGLTLMAAQAQIDAPLAEGESPLVTLSDLEITESKLQDDNLEILPADRALFRMTTCLLRVSFLIAQGLAPRASFGIDRVKLRYNELCDSVRKSTVRPQWKWFPSRIMSALTLHLTACACRSSLSSRGWTLRTAYDAWGPVARDFAKFARGVNPAAGVALRNCLGESLARSLLCSGKLSKAAALLAGLGLQGQESSGVAMAKGELCVALGRNVDAVERYSEALLLGESDEAKAFAWARCAVIERQSKRKLFTEEGGRCGTALDGIRKPKRPRTRCGQVAAVIEMGEGRGSIALLESAQACLAATGSDGNETLRALIWLALAVEYIGEGRSDAAMEMVDLGKQLLLDGEVMGGGADVVNLLHLQRTLVRCMEHVGRSPSSIEAEKRRIEELQHALEIARHGEITTRVTG